MPAESNFDKLTDGNYFEWRIYMEALLTRKNLLDVVDGTTRHPGGTEGSKKVRDFYRRQAEARAELILRVTPSQLAHCRNTDPYVIWSDLANVHSAQGRSTVISIRRRFHRLRLDKSETMSAYIARARHLAFLLEEAGVTVHDDDIMLAITAGLPHSYDSFLISLDGTADSDYTLNNVIPRLVNEYQRQHQTQPRQPATTDNSERDDALAVTLAQITCFNCQQKGHFKANCPDRNPNPSSRASSNTAGTITAAANCVAELSDDESSDYGGVS